MYYKAYNLKGLHIQSTFRCTWVTVLSGLNLNADAT